MWNPINGGIHGKSNTQRYAEIEWKYENRQTQICVPAK